MRNARILVTAAVVVAFTAGFFVGDWRKNLHGKTSESSEHTRVSPEKKMTPIASLEKSIATKDPTKLPSLTSVIVGSDVPGDAVLVPRWVLRNMPFVAIKDDDSAISKEFAAMLRLTDGEQRALQNIIINKRAKIKSIEKEQAKTVAGVDGSVVIDLAPFREAASIVKTEFDTDVLSVLGSERSNLMYQLGAKDLARQFSFFGESWRRVKFSMMKEKNGDVNYAVIDQRSLTGQTFGSAPARRIFTEKQFFERYSHLIDKL